ncbi:MULTISPECIES: RagB/SusD family nutrient uptake outer membrane protein [Butyricimonas]|uniref:RagB/SusD family nutrient uptake outer membrane protein n=1 Tax=Butyricimonas TaxID=574697 RepID=UPI0007FB2268|nr:MULTISPECIES: RagB/SusD family nutrient uptake outer membrane protein [Butyricimonas]
MKINILLMLGLVTLALFGCESFLEEKSQDEVRPSTVTDMEKILLGEAYFSKAEGFMFNYGTDIFSDNMTSNAVIDNKDLKKRQIAPRFRWERDMFDESCGYEDLSFWKVPYARIKGCNLVIEYAPKMKGDEKKRNHLIGEAHVLRGYYYMFLVNCFGWSYNYGDPTANLGVPLKLVSGVTDEFFTRNTVAEVYGQIEKDLLLGAQLMEENAMELYLNRLNATAANALLMRMYLYMEDWDNVVKYANKVLAVRPGLLNLSEQPVSQYSSYSVYTDVRSDEILWGMPWDAENSYITWGNIDPYSPSDELIAMFQQDLNGAVDVRGDWKNNMTAYLKGGDVNIKTGGYRSMCTWVDKGRVSTPFNGGIRTGEVYVSRAEAYCRKYLASGNVSDAEKALEDLNELRYNRFYEGYVDKELSEFATAGELLDFCQRERRRELCGEGNHRWFDLKRMGMPEIKHIFVDNATGEGQVYTLSKEDKRYLLPIPRKEIDRCPTLKQNQY